MATLQVKGLDDALYKALAARAAIDHRSISQEVVVIVRDFLSRGHAKPEETTEAFLRLAGSWADERSAKTIARGLRSSRTKRTRPHVLD